MAKKSADKTVRKTTGQIPAATVSDLERLRRAMRGQIDTTEIPERRRLQRLKRDAAGRLPPRKSVIRDAVSRQMRDLNLTAYRLWRLARVYCPTLSQSAVHEFLRGERQLELPSVEALLAAVDLQLVKKQTTRSIRNRQRSKKIAQ
jgi:hypothetical protein